MVSIVQVLGVASKMYARTCVQVHAITQISIQQQIIMRTLTQHIHTNARARVIPHQITHMQSLHTCLSCHSQHPVPTPLHSPSLLLCTNVYRHTHMHQHTGAFTLFAYRTTHSSHTYGTLHGLFVSIFLPHTPSTHKPPST